jgi:hypothetical protein
MLWFYDYIRAITSDFLTALERISREVGYVKG